MRRAYLLVLAGTLLTDIAAADIVRRNAIPKPYIGSWALNAESCQAGGKGTIVLSARRYISADTKCVIRAVYETAGLHGPIYSARTQCVRALGGRGRTTENLIIVPAGTGQLSMGSDFNNLESYQRCHASTRPRRNLR
jgi:hypothetical protein